MIHELRRLANRVRFALGRGKITFVDDSGLVQIVQVDFGPTGANGSLAIRDKLARVSQFGFSSNPPIGSHAIAAHTSGDRSNGVVLGTNHQASRLVGLLPGESAIHDQWGNVVKMTEAGIEITHSALVTITAGTIALAGEVDITGTLKVGGVVVTVP